MVQWYGHEYMQGSGLVLKFRKDEALNGFFQSYDMCCCVIVVWVLPAMRLAIL